jgi:hypothetical protein
MGVLLERETLADVVLVCADGRELRAHKAVLAAHSDVSLFFCI